MKRVMTLQKQKNGGIAYNFNTGGTKQIGVTQLAG
jgi:hypothetical protein